MAKRVNPRRIKRHRNYTIEEAASALGVAKGTIRNWMERGLPVLKDQRPFLILGHSLVSYLDARKPSKQTCQPHQCYCFKCRSPRNPAFGEVEYFPANADGGSIRALCTECATVMHKRISAKAIPAIERQARVQIRND